ncbi:MAG: DUF3592 domain-containing protein [Lachnospiraceae bacterium]|nr:DUF3592 domain-containing protein [Lachnospiraceae bacterium]
MKKDYLIFGIFGLVGVIFLIVCTFLTISGKKFDETAVEVSGTIMTIESYRDSDGDRHHRVYVDYEYQGRKYKDVRLNSYNSSMREGKEIILKLDPDNPEKVRTLHGNLIASVIMGGMGLIFVLVGIIPTVLGIRKDRRNKKLREQGRYIYAIVERIDINYSYSLNGRHPFVVYCNYQDEFSGVLYRFMSDNIWTDPYPILQQGSEVRVYVDGQDYSKYHVDVESYLQGRVVDYT